MAANIRLGGVTPILRIFDEARARAFFVDYLGFHPVWEHRFGDDAPLYMAVRRDDCELHLSEHHGDGTPGSAIRVPVHAIVAFHGELEAKEYAFLHPAMEKPPWGGQEITLLDPFCNRITFFERDS